MGILNMSEGKPMKVKLNVYISESGSYSIRRADTSGPVLEFESNQDLREFVMWLEDLSNFSSDKVGKYTNY